MWSRQRIVFSSDTRTKGGAPNPKLWLFGDRGTHQINPKISYQIWSHFPPPPKKNKQEMFSLMENDGMSTRSDKNLTKMGHFFWDQSITASWNTAGVDGQVFGSWRCFRSQVSRPVGWLLFESVGICHENQLGFFHSVYTFGPQNHEKWIMFWVPLADIAHRIHKNYLEPFDDFRFDWKGRPWPFGGAKANNFVSV